MTQSGNTPKVYSLEELLKGDKTMKVKINDKEMEVDNTLYLLGVHTSSLFNNGYVAVRNSLDVPAKWILKFYNGLPDERKAVWNERKISGITTARLNKAGKATLTIAQIVGLANHAMNIYTGIKAFEEVFADKPVTSEDKPIFDVD